MFNSDDIHVTRRLAEEGLLVVIQPKTKIEWRPFEEARKFARSLGLKSQKEWYEYAKSDKKPKDLPSAPWQVYKSDWKGMGDWLGTGNIAPHKKIFRSFRDARILARSLGLGSVNEWCAWRKSGRKPEDIPYRPEQTYRDDWISWGDWLQSGNVSQSKRIFRPFEEARAYVHGLLLGGEKDWRNYCISGDKPEDIPSHPRQVYKTAWRGFGDWLGTGTVATNKRVFLSFREAREFVRSLGFKNEGEWRTYRRSGNKPKGIPSCPAHNYRDEWKGWGDWLGTGFVALRRRVYRPFAEARAVVRSLGIQSGDEWKSYSRSGEKPEDIPSTPWVVYESDWKGMGDWLGTGSIATRYRRFLPFKEGRAFARDLGLKSVKEWRAYCASGDRCVDVPVNPDIVYRGDWKSWYDWLGTEGVVRRRKIFRPFREAREVVRSFGFRTVAEWRSCYRLGNIPKGIPSCPERTYQDEWVSWFDWLGK